jgi:hypothetical protein
VSITDQPTTTKTTDALATRIDDRLDVWRKHTALAQEALADALALMLGKPLPAEVPVDRFVSDILRGDQVLWQDGWWLIAAAYTCSDGVTLTLTRSGHAPLELRFAGNETITAVRAAP